MRISHSNLWDAKADLYVVTTNGYINRFNEVVMGRGAALQAKKKFPEIALVAGQTIKLNFDPDSEYLYKYGFLHFGNIGLFQVKYHYADKADLELVKYSAIKLYLYLEEFDYDYEVHMNYPAIGYGGLRREEVEPIISTILPDNVTVHLMTDYEVTG